MSYLRTQAIEAYGWTAVPRKVSALLSQSQATGPAPALSISSLPVPTTPLSTAVNEYAKKELSIETYNHSLRVYSYGLAILQHAFPTWSTTTFIETYFLTSLLHDIGTTNTNITATLLSFEFYGGILTLDLLKSLSAPVEQAESVAEAVIRHQDLGETGTLSRIGGLVQLATIFDNMGKNEELVARETVEAVVGAWPRSGWSGCFAATIRKENGLKPWAHTTHLGEEDFPNGVLGNELMAPYDNLQ
jgi:cyanamide hydratase